MDQALQLIKRDTCDNGNDYDGRMGVRISAIFVILLGGTFGSCFPVLASRLSGIRLPWWTFFAAKFFGSGVIITTALLHLLQPANQALSDECLSEAWQNYPYAFGICLVVLFLTFFLDIVSTRYLQSRGMCHDHGPSGFLRNHHKFTPGKVNDIESGGIHEHVHANDPSTGHISGEGNDLPIQPNCNDDIDEAAMTKKSVEDVQSTDSLSTASFENLAAQLGSLFFLEFGIIFHSIFIGLTLAVSGEEFTSLYIVLIFHQTFEGLGLGTRIAQCQFPSNKKWLPWLLAIAFGLTTPIAIAIGLGVRKSYPPNSATALITNGIFDSISSGILLYVGTVELMGNEFLHSEEFAHSPFIKVFSAFAVMCCGAGLMALLARWA